MGVLHYCRGIAVSDEDRFMDIEIKLSQQEDLVESLNQVVYQQSRRIDQLEQMVSQLADRVRNQAPAGPGVVLNEKPPHY
jgi:SlyX protein